MFNRVTNFIQAISWQRWLFLFLIVAAMVGGGGSYYFYGKYRALKANPNLEVQKETAALVSALSKLMQLPLNEVPTIATVSQKEKLSGQAFFTSAENGDIVFAYTRAMQAILYRPRTNKIINVAPISIDQAQNLTPRTERSAPPLTAVRIGYYNGTETVGLTGQLEKTVKEKYPNWSTVTLANAARKDYTGTLVIDLSGQHSKQASDLALLLKAQVGPLPPGELTPDADILIIAGK